LPIFEHVNVLLFGSIAELAKANEVSTSATSTFGVKQDLERRIGGLDKLSYAIAVDRVIVKDDKPLTGNEEIALLPPFAGG
jgi:molybdopterin synthase sulfur carrier subunit